MEDNPFENAINSTENCWLSNGPKTSSAASQHILLDGSESNFSHPVHGKDVVVMASQASGIDQEGVGSSMVKFKPIVNYDWECKLEYGNLVVCHTNKTYFAYVLRNYTQGTTSGIVRVTNMKTTQRTLLKNFVGKVADLSFADTERVILGAVDSVGNLFVYELFEENDQTLGQKLLLSCIRSDKNLAGNIHRLIWCSYIGEEDKPASDVGGGGEMEAPLDDSLMLLLTHNEIAELWHVDLITRMSSSVQVSTDAVDCGFYVIKNHSQAITDAAFSPDATAVATASLDGDVKFFQVDVTDSNPPKCIHYWQPHEGKPISFLHFLDDHKNKNPQAHLWKFAVTGCGENQTIRIWDCQNWSCLQTLTFVSPVVDLMSIEDAPAGDFRGMGHATNSSIKAKFDLSSSYLVLSDMKRRVIYVLEVITDGNEARISSVSEFLLMNPCLSFAVVDACAQRGSNRLDNGFQMEQDWPIDHSEDDFECGRSQRASVSIKLYSVHSRALQELHIKFIPKSPSIEMQGEVAGISSAVSSIRDLFSGANDDLPSISKGSILAPSSNFSASSIVPILTGQVATSPIGNQAGLAFPQERQTSSLSSSTSTLPQTPFLLAPDAFVSPRDMGRGALSSSVDFGGDEDEDEDDDNEVEVRGDVEGADRDVPDGGSRVRTSGGGGSTGSHFFDRGGDGGGDGDSSGASTASQEVTEILEGVEEAMAGLDVTTDQDKNGSYIGDADEDDKFSGSHLRTIDPQTAQLPQPPVVHPHHSFMPQQQHIAHHIPNMLQMLYKDNQPSSSSAKIPGLNHQSLLNTEQSPRNLAHQSLPTHSSPMNTKWPQAVGIINVDELMRKSEALEMSHKERRNQDGGATLPFIEADELERRFFNSKESVAEAHPSINTSLCDLMELIKSQNEELKLMSSKLQQQAQLESCLRTANLQIDVLSKEVRLLSASLERIQAASSVNILNEEKLNELFERQAQKVDENMVNTLQLFVENMKGSMVEHVGKIVSADIKTNVVPKLEQSLESIKDKLSNELNHKLSSVDNAIRNTITKVFKTKSVTDGIGQCLSTDLKGTLRSLYQDALGPSFEKGCSNVVQQLNSTFQVGTQQYTKNLETHLTQLRKAIESQKYPVIQQMKSTADALAQNNVQQKQANSQLLGYVEYLQSQGQGASKQVSLDEEKLLKLLNEHSELMAKQVRDIVSEKLACILKDHQVAIKDQFESALRSVTPAPSTSSFSDHHQQLKAQISQNLHLNKYNNAFQQALSASDLKLVEFTCEHADPSVVFGDQCLLSQSVILSLIQQLAANLEAKTELKYRYLDEAIVSLDPNDPVTKEHLNGVMEQLCSNLISFLDHKSGGMLDRDLRKLLKRATVLLKSHPRSLLKY